MTRVEQIRAILQQTLDPIQLTIDDDSARHAGHVGARDGRGHFQVSIVASAFQGKSLVARHRLVYDALKTLLQTDIHALSITARSPEEIQSQENL